MTADTLAATSATADLHDIPLAEMPALGMGVLGRVIGRALPPGTSLPVRAESFQSSI